MTDQSVTGYRRLPSFGSGWDSNQQYINEVFDDEGQQFDFVVPQTVETWENRSSALMRSVLGDQIDELRDLGAIGSSPDDATSVTLDASQRVWLPDNVEADSDNNDSIPGAGRIKRIACEERRSTRQREHCHGATMITALRYWYLSSQTEHSR